VLEGVALRGDEVALDVGCGSGRLTALLLERLPRGRVVALDRTPSMIAAARGTLAPFGARVEVREMDVLELRDRDAFDLVFSTATFHWIHDHARLFRVLFAALRPGGRLVAQCGGGANVARMHARAEALLDEPAYASFFEGFAEPWHFADDATTRGHLEAAGFRDIDVSLVPAPTPFADRASFREFAEAVVLGSFVQRIGDPALRARFVDTITDQAERDDPPFEIDYVRLNIRAARPV
jgi:trans-aconitate 2-methyltransferase